ncbi:hypothetical protein B0T14DRAFT_518492 [Immersiella caudata]|uniref:Zn(2)-C6 fungal-type domain-containing protein n=1 Tax=Immersiella caudata TaxID=314043 RepID=A0AA39WP99_9PEZI|nr:hypothetical protein B0T14DRAFT_518492 [Immersiella caudata]
MADTPDPRGRQRTMRLGTRSCAECRRRKARCVYPDGSRICEGCALRQCPCVAQGSGRPRTMAQPSPDRGNGDLRQRVQRLENTMLRLCYALERPSDAEKTQNVKTSVAKALQHLQLPRTDAPESNTDGDPDDEEDSALYSTDGFDDGLDAADAPLVALLRAAAMLDREGSGSSVSSVAKGSNSSRVQDISSNFARTLLQDNDLRSVIDDTHKYWKIWPACSYGPRHIDTLQCADPSVATSLLSDMIRSEDPSVMAKAVLFIALCIQQLPRAGLSESLPSSPKVVVASYIRTADDLLHIAAGIRETIDAAEAWVLESKLYINMGKPRQAWLCLRRAANAALLLGLHRTNGHGRTERVDSLWAQIWQTERLCSLSLGLPSAISNQHPAMSSSPPSLNEIHDLFRHRLCLALGTIIERNQRSPLDYLATVKIEEDLEQCRSLLPDEFWSQPHRPDQSFVDIYYRQITKVLYSLSIMMVHIPFILKASTDRKYEHNRISAMNAARDVITNYSLLRQVADAEYIICEVLDFQVFSAGMILLINLFSHPPLSAQENTNEDLRLTEALAETLQRTASLMSCDVARQGSHVLSLLIQVHRGSYKGPDRFVGVMPYFGKVKISFPTNRASAESAAEANPNAASSTSTGSVEFSVWSSDQDFPMTVDLEQGLGGDWVPGMGEDVGLDYDWSYTFTCD